MNWVKETVWCNVVKNSTGLNRRPRLTRWALGAAIACLLTLAAPINNLPADEKQPKTAQTKSTSTTKKSAQVEKPEQGTLQLSSLSEAKKIMRQWMRKFDQDKDKLLSEDELAQAIYTTFATSTEKQEELNPASETETASKRKPVAGKQEVTEQITAKEKKAASTKKELAPTERMPKQAN